jgi:hypothetical protein
MELTIGKHTRGPTPPISSRISPPTTTAAWIERGVDFVCARKRANAPNSRISAARKSFRITASAMNAQVSHQAKWRKSVVEVYNAAPSL